MIRSTLILIALWFGPLVSPVPGQGFGYPDPAPLNRDIMVTNEFSFAEYRHLMINGRTPSAEELIGCWRGVNKGIVEIVGYRQFIKEMLPNGSEISGDNIQVQQLKTDLVRGVGWQPKVDPRTGQPIRNGHFVVEPPDGRGRFHQGVVFSYREGANGRVAPVNLLVDKVVVLDSGHLLGRATANLGPLQIPLAYFVLERM